MFKRKISLLAGSVLTKIGLTVSHTTGTETMMGNSSWMYGTGQMMPMWGMGVFGSLFFLTMWVLMVMGIIYLYQKITER